MPRSTNLSKRLDWQVAPDIKKRVFTLLRACEIDWVKANDLHFFRSQGAKTRVFARIWGLNRIWQMALGQKPAYIIEVVSERFDKLTEVEKDKVLLHELTHIPKNFSGALIPHVRHGKHSFYDKVHKLIASYLKEKNK